VIDSRPAEGGEAIRRRRECQQCKRRYTTYERVEEAVRITVVKKDGTRVPYDRNKIMDGIQRACYKRPVPAQTLSGMVDAVEEQIQRNFDREVPSSAIGELVMRALRGTDPIAFVRFASVYREFRDIGELAQEVQSVMDDGKKDPQQPDLFQP
jgi:transcriptional repressor NrdR